VFEHKLNDCSFRAVYRCVIKDFQPYMNVIALNILSMLDGLVSYSL